MMKSSGGQGLSGIANETVDISRGKGAHTNKWRGLVAGISAVAAMLSGGLYQVTTPQAYAAGGTGKLASITAIVAADGTTTVNDVDGANPVVVNGDTLDDSDHNGKIATNDIVSYDISVDYAADVQVGDVMTLVGVLPNGVQWQTTSYSTGDGGTCDASTGNLITNTPTAAATLTCKWTVLPGKTGASFHWNAKVMNSPLYSGLSFYPTFKDGNSTLSIGGPSLEVVSAPILNVTSSFNNYGISKTTYSNSNPAFADYNGKDGYSLSVRVSFAATTARGYEALSLPLSFDIDVPNNIALRTMDYAGDGSNSISQFAIGDMIHVFLSNNSTNTLNISNIATIVYLFVPDESLDQTIINSINVTGTIHVPQGISGRPASIVGATPTAQVKFNIQYFADPILDDSLYVMAQMGSDKRFSTGSLNGQNPTNSNYNSGVMRILPGASFVPAVAVRNRANAGANMVGASSCVTWDSSLAIFQGQTLIAGMSDSTGTSTAAAGQTINYAAGLVTGSALPSSAYTLEYASVPGLVGATATALSSFSCWPSADDGVVWTDDPADLGGPGQVNAVRLKINVDVAPGKAFTLQLQMQVSPTLAQPDVLQAAGRSIVIYASQARAGLATTYPLSFKVGVDTAQVRAATTVDAANVPSTRTVRFSVKPTVIGPLVDGLDTVATDTQIKLSFDTSCVDVTDTVTYLKSVFEPLYGTSVLINGIDTPVVQLTSPGGLCTPTTQSTDGPVITISLGDVTAHGSATAKIITMPSGNNYVPLNEQYILAAQSFTVPVKLSLFTADGTIFHMTTLMSSSSDTTSALHAGTPSGSTLDRSSWATVTVSAQRTFSFEKTVQTAESGTTQDGLVNPGETFTYSLSMGNTEGNDYGVSTMVDVLPFDGGVADPRLNGQPNGLAGGLSLKVLAASGSMAVYEDGADVSTQTQLLVYCSTQDSSQIYNYLVGDDVTPGDPTGGGNSAADPSGGPFGWQECSGAIPSGTTAVKFVTAGNVPNGASAQATITVQAPPLAVGGYLINDMAYQAPVPALGTSTRPVAIPRQGVTAAQAKLASNSAGLAGTVRQDRNFNSGLDAVVDPATTSSDAWWPAGAQVVLFPVDPVTGAVSATPLPDLTSPACQVDMVTLQASGCDPYMAVVAVDGSFEFPVIPAGQYQAGLVADELKSGLRSADDVVWRQVINDTDLPQLVTVVQGRPATQADCDVSGVTGCVPNTTDDLLYQEIIAAPELVDDPAGVVSAQQSLTIDVLGNDTVHVTQYTSDPVIPDKTQTVTLPSATSEHGGEVALVAATDTTTRAATGSQVKYTPAVGFTGEDSFEYSWCNVYRECDTAVVTLRVAGPPTLAMAPQQVVSQAQAQKGLTFGNKVTVDTVNGATLVGCSLVSTYPEVDGVTVDPATAEVTFQPSAPNPTPVTTYTVTVKCADSVGGEAEGTNTVIVAQLLRLSADPSEVVTIAGGDAIFSNDLAYDTQYAGPVSCAVVPAPEDVDWAAVTVDNDGSLSVTGIDASMVGTSHDFTVTCIDSLGQFDSVVNTVIVADTPVLQVDDDSIRVVTQSTASAGVVFDNTLFTDTGNGILPDHCAISPADGATFDLDKDSGVVTVTSTAAAPGTYIFTVQCWDSEKQASNTVTNTVIVATAPQVTVDTARTVTGERTILEGASTSFANRFRVDGTLLPDGETPAVTVHGCVIDTPVTGASIDTATGAVSFDSSKSGHGVFTVNITCTDSLGQTATGVNTVTVLYGEITIDKSGALTTSGKDKVGDTITWQFTVENTGTADLIGVTINDTLTDGVLGDITCGDDKTPNGEVTLAAHESIKCTATSAITLEQKNAGAADNTATASATAVDPQDADNTSVTVESGESSWTVPLSWNAKVSVKKDAHVADSNYSGKIDAGDQITFVITLHNMGDVSVYGITIKDSMPGLTVTCDGQDNGAINLAPDEKIVCTTDPYTITAADAAAGQVVNVATINGKPGSENATPLPSQNGGDGVTGGSEVIVQVDPQQQAPTGGWVASANWAWAWLFGAGLLLAGGWLLLRRRQHQVGEAV